MPRLVPAHITDLQDLTIVMSDMAHINTFHTALVHRLVRLMGRFLPLILALCQI